MKKHSIPSVFFNSYASKNSNAPIGEDGVIAAILKEIGLNCDFCIELGAGDGTKNSVTHSFRENGSKSLLIDGAIEYENAADGSDSVTGKTSADTSIESIYANNCEVKIENITPKNINNIFDKYQVPPTPAFMAMCFEDHEYHIWKSLAYRPAVVLIAYNRYIRPDIKLTTPYNFHRKFYSKTRFSHATCSAMADLGIKKGYTLVEVASYKMYFIANEFANSLRTAKDFQNDWLFLYLKNGLHPEELMKIERLSMANRAALLNNLRKDLKSKFYNYEQVIWDNLGIGKFNHIYGDWELIP